MLLNAFAMLVGAGGAPRTAMLWAGDRQQAEKIISNSFTMLMFFAVVLTIGFYAGHRCCCGCSVPAMPPCRTP